MSIVAYYARLSREQLEACASDPESLSSGQASELPGVELIDIDHAFEPLAWLVSPCKRAEQDYSALLMAEMRQPPHPPSFLARLFGKKPDFEPSNALKAKGKACDDFPVDPALIAIEGRTDSRDDRIDFGMGSASVFDPESVAILSEALSAIDSATLATHFDPETMDRMNVFPEHWVEEGNDLMQNYVQPSLERLQTFYRAACEHKQIVLMWYI